MSEAGSCLVTSPGKPCDCLCPWRCSQLGYQEGGFLPWPSRPSGMASPSGLPGLYTRSVYLFTEDLYPPTPSRVNFAQWEHPEVTSC